LPTCGSHSVGIVRLQTKLPDFFFFMTGMFEGQIIESELRQKYLDFNSDFDFFSLRIFGITVCTLCSSMQTI
jgi:hypothetical protein